MDRTLSLRDLLSSSGLRSIVSRLVNLRTQILDTAPNGLKGLRISSTSDVDCVCAAQWLDKMLTARFCSFLDLPEVGGLTPADPSRTFAVSQGVGPSAFRRLRLLVRYQIRMSSVCVNWHREMYVDEYSSVSILISVGQPGR